MVNALGKLFMNVIFTAYFEMVSQLIFLFHILPKNNSYFMVILDENVVAFNRMILPLPVF